MTGDILVRCALPTDAAFVAELERSYIDKPWSRDMIADQIQKSDALFFVATCSGELAGYLSGDICADECELCNVAVLPEYRRRGVASALFNALHAGMAERGVHVVFLLVRDDNAGAIALYNKLGYKKVGVRPRYYSGKDALIMRKEL